MEDKLWWKESKRIIQYNLQMKDAPLMDAKKIAQDTLDMGGNAITVNAGGVSAWYPTKVPFHEMNEHIPEGRDILQEVLEACHEKGIKVYARTGWSLVEEGIYHQKPHWIVRMPDGSPVAIGNDRPGLWRKNYPVCVNSGFSNEEVMLPVLDEIIENYDVDGIFWVGGFVYPCWCETCKKKYMKKYGKPLPDDFNSFEKDWLPSCGEENAMLFYNLMKEKRPNMPFIRYYLPISLNMGPGMQIAPDNIDDRAKSGNILCSEAQDILSLGAKKIPEWHTPAIRMKMGRTIDGMPPPIGIIHMCPGMDWRHVGMPDSEYLYWSSQVVANGGQLWSTLTGFNDTISDKRQFKAIAQVNNMIKNVEKDMDGAKSAAQVLLFADDGVYVQPWADALLRCHIEFDMLAQYQFAAERLEKYAVVILTGGFRYDAEAGAVLEKYVAGGGRIIVEGISEAALAPILPLLGIKDLIVTSEPMVAMYMRLEVAGSLLRKRIEESDLVPLRGRIGFCEAKEDAEVLATWVPSFSAFQDAGNPPERASLPALQTKVPLCVVNSHLKGKVMFLPYEPGSLISEFKMRDFYTMVGAYVDTMLGENKRVEIAAPSGVMASIFRKDNCLMVHYVNGVGTRPLQENNPCYNIKLSMKLNPGDKVKAVSACISGQQVSFDVDENVLTVELPKLEVWDMLKIEFDS
jgi:hypothetical protein